MIDYSLTIEMYHQQTSVDIKSFLNLYVLNFSEET